MPRKGDGDAKARAIKSLVDQYLDATTIEDFRPRHLRVVGARDLGLDREEQALVEPAPFLAN
jgi:hypothetical protein